ncbi:metallophosphoesterase [Rhizobium sp. TRM95111]|uniref:metallophosphoesterase n=1 Tax=Rhizobium alarense TaxID=2846851 RepID=UPI001F2DC9DE|nr:metallophosphoesterase [Rhizobium alarense]MCF3638424.1 metallophosphoesterase [Rhizobium alarense]
MLTRRSFLKAIGGSTLVGLALGSYAFAVEPLVRLRIARYRLQPAGWPAGRRLRIAALSDIHACEPWMSAARIRGICARANALEADIIVLLGDYVSGMRFRTGDVAAAVWAKALADLDAPLGVHAILGNHDWWDDVDAQRTRGPTIAGRALQDAGIAVYSNRAQRIETPGGPFWLAGLEDQWALLPREEQARYGMTGLDDLDGTLATVTDDEPVVLLAHEPDIFPRVPSRVSLTLSGHTHGGQVRVFGYAPVVPSAYGNRYAYGHVSEGGRDIVISGGLGCSIAPIRFGSPPEITVIDLG